MQHLYIFRGTRTPGKPDIPGGRVWSFCGDSSDAGKQKAIAARHRYRHLALVPTGYFYLLSANIFYAHPRKSVVALVNLCVPYTDSEIRRKE